MHRFVVFVSPIVSSIIQINSWCYCWLGLAGGRCRWCGGCRWAGRRPAPRSTGTPARSSEQMREHKVGAAGWQLTYLLQLLSPSRRPFVWILNLRGPSSHLSTCSEVWRHYYLDYYGSPWRARSCLATSAPCPPSRSTWPPTLDTSAHYSCYTFARLVMRGAVSKYKLSNLFITNRPQVSLTARRNLNLPGGELCSPVSETGAPVRVVFDPP